MSVSSGESRQPTPSWPHTKRPRWWIVRLPNDILLGRATSHVPQGPFKETNSRRQRVEFVQKIVDSFWKRWTRYVFPSLIPRKKWNAEKRNVQVDDFVIVQTPNAIRGNWNIGRIVNVYPGQDGKVRNVRVKTGTGEYDRPVTKIVVIHPADGYEWRWGTCPHRGGVCFAEHSVLSGLLSLARALFTFIANQFSYC